MSGPLEITRVLHVSVNSAADPDKVRSFYAALLGSPSPRPEVPGVPGTWFANGQVHLVETAESMSQEPHWCLGVRSLSKATATLSALSVEVVRGEQAWPDGTVTEQVWFRDPTGAVIELQEDVRVVPGVLS